MNSFEFVICNFEGLAAYNLHASKLNYIILLDSDLKFIYDSLPPAQGTHLLFLFNTTVIFIICQTLTVEHQRNSLKPWAKLDMDR